MSEDEFDRQVLARISLDRREFVKRVLRGAAFTAPVIASFDMSSALAAARRDSRRGTIRNPVSNGTIFYGNGWQDMSEHASPEDYHHGDNPGWQ
jgi:hypothetical protein